MSPQTSQLEAMLETVGRAHRAGAFSADAARLPWQGDSRETVRLTHRRLAWVRVAVPLAAAAAVAVLFVGPSLFETTAVDEITGTIPSVVMPDQPEAFAEAEPTPTTAQTLHECDYNGDGRVDGKDIQAFVNRVQDTGGDLELETEKFQRCLLGNG
jgi:hypothetical protein